jgi:hypothetical protein
MPNTKISRHHLVHDWVPDIEEDRGTAAESITRPPVPPSTRTAVVLITEGIGRIREQARTLSISAGQAHQVVYQREWSVLTQQRGIQSPVDLLSELGEMGFAWRDVARLIGVSVPAVQKWRKGERLSGDNRYKLTSLVAACDFLVGHFHIEDVASWFEMRITESAPITPIDLWASGERVLFFDYGTGHLAPEETLDKFDPEWRERYRTDFVTFRDEDGNLGLRMRER